MLAELKGKKIMLGVLELGDMTIETRETVADRIHRALAYVAAEDIIVGRPIAA